MTEPARAFDGLRPTGPATPFDRVCEAARRLTAAERWALRTALDEMDCADCSCEDDELDVAEAMANRNALA